MFSGHLYFSFSSYPSSVSSPVSVSDGSSAVATSAHPAVTVLL
jgi:hypothetical protein